MSAQKQVIYADAIMDDAVPGTIAWLCFGPKGRLDFSMEAGKPFMRAELRCRVVGAGEQIELAYIDSLPDDFDGTIVSVTLKMIKDRDGRWHTVTSAIERREP